MKLIIGDAFEALKRLPDETVNCCVTSPPYYGLRDYGVDDQIGLEDTPQEYISKLVSVFHEVKRVLKKDGTLWVNVGDSYAGSGKGRGKDGKSATKSEKQNTNIGSLEGKVFKTNAENCKPKDLIGIPWMLAFALREDGWYLRQDIIWAKPNPMPESVKDRCTKSHEYIFLLSKTEKYYFDCNVIQEDANPLYQSRYNSAFNKGKEQDRTHRKDGSVNTAGMKKYTGKRNKRDVWNISVKHYKGAHFAVFPDTLIEPCVLAGCPKGGVVLDPFAGSGTTLEVAFRHDRDAIGIELNPAYADLIKDRLGIASCLLESEEK